MKKVTTVKLIYKTRTGQDHWGNPMRQTTEKEVFASVKSVSQNEFYNSAASGFRV